MIAVCQPFSRTGRFHLSFDSSLLSAICLAAPGEEVLYLSDSENLARMQGALVPAPPNVRFQAAGRTEAGARRLRLRARLWAGLRECRASALRGGARLIVHVAFDTPTAALHLLRGSPVPECFIVHNNFQRAEGSHFEGACFRWVARRAARLIFLEEPVAQAAAGRYGIAPDRRAVIPHPIPAPSIPLDPPSTGAGTGSGIVMAGTLTASKGLATLVEAAAILRQENPAALRAMPVRVAGPRLSGPDPGRYAELLDHQPAPLTDGDLDALILGSRFVVLPYEPAAYAYVTPGTLYRALALGRPVVVRDLPSIASLKEESPSPVLTFSEPRQLSCLMIRLAALGPEEYSQLCASARRIAARRLPASLVPCVKSALGLDPGAGAAPPCAPAPPRP